MVRHVVQALPSHPSSFWWLTTMKSCAIFRYERNHRCPLHSCAVHKNQCDNFSNNDFPFDRFRGAMKCDELSKWSAQYNEINKSDSWNGIAMQSLWSLLTVYRFWRSKHSKSAAVSDAGVRLCQTANYAEEKKRAKKGKKTASSVA